MQGSAERRSPGLVNSTAAAAYHFCLALPAAFTHPGGLPLAKPCASFAMHQQCDVKKKILETYGPPLSINVRGAQI